MPPASYTFQQVQEHTDQIWKFQRHDFIEEYQSRSPAPPPFILLSHLQLFIKRLVLKIPAKRHRQLSKPGLCRPRARAQPPWGLGRAWGGGWRPPLESWSWKDVDRSGPRPPGSPLGGRGVGSSCRSGHRHPQADPLPRPLYTLCREQAGGEGGGSAPVLGDLPEGELPAEPAEPAAAAAGAQDPAHQ